MASQTLFTLVDSSDSSETFVILPFDLAHSIRCLWAEAKAQLVKGFPNKHQDLCFDNQNLHKHTCNPSAGKVGADIPDQPG